MTGWVNDRRPTAIHEAGHAFMACHLEVPFDCVSLVETVHEGEQRNGGLHGLPVITSKEQAEALATTGLAGWAACCVMGVANYGFNLDVKFASETLWSWHGSDAPAAFKECKARALKIIGENKSAVKRIADLLLERDTLDRPTVQACISQSGADLTH